MGTGGRYHGEGNTLEEIAWKGNNLRREIFWDGYPEEGNFLEREISLGTGGRYHEERDAMARKMP